MINITLPDNSVRSYENSVSPMDVAKDISEGFARNVISASFNGTTVETSTPLTEDGTLTWMSGSPSPVRITTLLVTVGRLLFWYLTNLP